MWAKRALLMTVALVAGCAGPAPAGGSHSTGVRPSRLWEAISDRPNPALVDDFEMIEGLRLVPSDDTVSDEAAVLAAVVTCGLERVLWDAEAERWLRGGDYPLIREFYERVPDRFGGEGRAEYDRQCQEVAQQALQAVEQRRRVARETRPEAYGEPSVGQCNALLLQSCLDDTGSIGDAVELLAGELAYTVRVQEERLASFETLRDAVNRGIAPVLTSPEHCLLCVGYIACEGGPHLVLFRPSAGSVLTVAEPDVPEPPAGVTDVSLGRRQPHSGHQEHRDVLLDLDGPMPSGVSIEPFTTGERSALYIHSWEPDLERLLDDLGARIEEARQKGAEQPPG